MNFRFRIPILLHVFISLIRHSDLAKPLIFNLQTMQIYNSSSNSSNKNVDDIYAIACPLDTENKSEKKIDKLLTLDHKGLFVFTFIHTATSLAQPHAQCKKGFELAAAYKPGWTGDVFEFGYEIYCKYGQLPFNLHNAYHKKYTPVSYARSIWKQSWRISKYSDDYYDDFGVYHRHRYSDHDDYEDFIWLKKIGLRYNIASWNVKEITYKIGRHRNISQQVKIKCKDHDLGSTFYHKKGASFDEFYSTANQKKTFANVQLPEGNGCQTKYECVKKYDLLMPYHVEPYPGSPVSCSNLTTIAIWHERSEELLNNVERFLIAIAQSIPNELRITSGVHGVLSFPKKKFFRVKSTPVYLYQRKGRIPVPKIIFKIIKYQTFDCNEKAYSCWFDLIIVIHNQPVFKEEEKLCPKDKCREWGWERIQITKTPAKERNYSEYIYCCEWNDTLRDVLGYQKGNYIQRSLDLNNFPTYDSKKYEHSYKNLKQLFEKRLKQLEKETGT